jgi:hypothetical protein
VAIELVFETHSTTVDNEEGRATGWQPGRLLVERDFAWQEGWEYRIN